MFLAIKSGGIRFTDFHVGSSICTASRAALLTVYTHALQSIYILIANTQFSSLFLQGRIGIRTGILTNFDPESQYGLPLNETTIAEMLKTADYDTAMMGKWHLGTTKDYFPTARGFDYALTVPFSLDMGCVDPCGDPALQMPLTHPDPQDRCAFNNSSLNARETIGVPLMENGVVVEQPTNMCQLTDKYIAAAERFITQPHNGNPFFLYVPWSQVHVPHAHNPRFTGVSKKGMFGDVLAEMDDAVGRILAALDDAGVRNNTLIFLTGDNGPWASKCDLAGSSGPYTGDWLKGNGGGSTQKMTVWEGGHRVVGVFNWPGQIPAGQVSHELATTFDILPTFAGLSGAQKPANRQFDGIDLMPLLTGSKHAKGHDVLFHPNTRLQGATPAIVDVGAIRWKNYKVFHYVGGTSSCGEKGMNFTDITTDPLVFDLAKDPAESTPLVNGSERDNVLSQIDKLLQEVFIIIYLYIHIITRSNQFNKLIQPESLLYYSQKLE